MSMSLPIQMIMSSGHSFEGTLIGNRISFNNGIQISILPDSNIYTKTGKNITHIVKRIPNCINTEHLTCLYVMNKLSFLN